MNAKCDVVVIGCGPGGAAAAVFAAEAGLEVTVVERDTFPRYHIGESLTGTAGDILRELGLGAAMAERQFPVKSGVKVIGKAGNEYFVPVLAQTWQVRRDAFDSMLMERANQSGARIVRGRVVDVLRSGERLEGVVYIDDQAGPVALQSSAVIDASGTACVLANARVTGPRTFDDFGRQIAVFSQLSGCLRDPGEMGDNTFIFHAEMNHWAWFIPLSADVVSVGIVVPVERFKQLGARADGVFQWGLENLHPDLTQRTLRCPQVEPVRAVKDYSYRIEPFAGPGWFCVGDAHRFADPIFSFGVTASMQEARAAVSALLAIRAGKSWREAASDYTRYSNVGQDAIFDFITYFWKYPGFFGMQMRGRFRKDVIRLFGGDMFVPNEVIDRIREFMLESRPATPPATSTAS